MKRIIALLLASIMCLAFAGCGSEKSDYESVSSAKKLVIGVTYYEPICYFDDNNTLIGFDVEFAKAVCEKLDIEPQFQEISWNLKETELKSKNIDCIWNGLTVTEERRDNMDFSSSYLTNRQVVVIQKSDADKYTSAASLESASITAEDGSAGETAIKADASLNKATYTAAPKQVAALVSLVSGNVDAAVVDYTTAVAQVGNGSYENLQIVESITLANEEYAIGFRIGSDLTEKINTIINDLYNDGTLKTIAEKYGLSEQLEEAFTK